MQTRVNPAHPDAGLSFTELEEKIRTRAYYLHEYRGFRDGHALDDWLEAKAETLGVTKPKVLTTEDVAADQQ